MKHEECCVPWTGGPEEEGVITAMVFLVDVSGQADLLYQGPSEVVRAAEAKSAVSASTGPPRALRTATVT